MKNFFYLNCLIFLFSIFCIFKAFQNGNLRFNYPDKKKYPIRGIDISHHQGKINWESLKKEKLNFVIVKATEGKDYKDSDFKKNIKSSIDEGYDTGAYHFYRLCKSGKEQALNYINTVSVSEISLPPFVDLEYGGNCDTGKSRRELKQELTVFLKILEEHYGRKPVLYATGDFYNDYLKNDYLDYGIWIRNIISKPKLENKRKWIFWQYANRGHLKGINGFVDLNIFNGSEEEYRDYIK